MCLKSKGIVPLLHCFDTQDAALRGALSDLVNSKSGSSWRADSDDDGLGESRNPKICDNNSFGRSSTGGFTTSTAGSKLRGRSSGVRVAAETDPVP